jgi:hypothetical protein
MLEIKDPLHGYIQLNDTEKQIVDTPPLQRLRRIRQLGLTSLVYPSATHTRFQHSLGVMHISGRFAESLNLDDERRRELRLAGLLHDTGHGPFSHASEMMAKQYGVSHEDFSCEVVDRLEDYYNLDPKRLHKIIRGKLEIGQVVAGDIDADRMDYLVRDALVTGVEHGQIDIDTIIRLAEIDSRRLVFNHKAVPALESLFTSRFHMLKTVYSHHTAEIAEKMLQRALDDLHNQGTGIEPLMRMDDYEAHNALLESEGVSHELYKRIKNRDLYKRALVLDRDTVSREELKRYEEMNESDLEQRIADEAGLDRHEVIVDTPSTPEIEDIDVKIKKEKKVRSMSEISPIPEALTTAEWRTVKLSVYCPDEYRDEVSNIGKQILE